MKAIDMTQGTPWKKIIKFSLPVMFGLLLQQLYNTADTIIVGKFSGENSLSAVGTTSSLTFLFLAIAMGFSLGNGIVVSQAFGAKDMKKVRDAGSTGIILLLSIGIVLTFVGYFSANVLFRSFVNVPQSFYYQTIKYFKIYSLGLFFQFGYNIFSAILRAIGDSVATLYFLLIASVVNIFLDLYFVGVLGMDVEGAALATNISQAISFVAAYFYMKRKYSFFNWKLNEYVWIDKYALNSINVGFPIALQLSIVSLGLTFIQRAVNSFGQAMTASFTVGQRIEMYLHIPCNAFQTTLATYTGQNVGAKKYKRIEEGVKQTVLISIALTTIISGLVLLHTRTIISYFSLSDSAARICVQHIMAIALITIILSSYIPLFGVLQGVNKSKIPTIVATCALTIRVLVTYLFYKSSFFGYSILWWNSLFGFGTGFTITWLCYIFIVKKGIIDKNLN